MEYNRYCVTALYMRISSKNRDLNKNKAESKSIVNQRSFIENYIKNHTEFSKTTLKEFCDDGFSGLTFERPAVKKLLQEAKEGLINCIVVKDFSRFGRNYIEIGDYLENLFPSIGIRFVSINDSYDSFKKNDFEFDIGFINMAYELYSKDISYKVKRGKKAAAQNGYFIGVNAPYGYKKSEDNRHKLIIDDYAALIVKRIFKMRIDGYKSNEIAVILNSEKIQPPSIYKQNISGKLIDLNKKMFWVNTSIDRIIKNECYIGNMVGNKSNIPKIRQKREMTEKSKLIIVENTHKAIVSRHDFKVANNTYLKYKKGKYKKSDNNHSNKNIVCGYCKRHMTFQKRKNSYYFCHVSQYFADKLCFNGKIYEKDLEKTLCKILEKLCYFYEDLEFCENRNEVIIYKELENQEVLYKKYKYKKIEIFEQYSLKYLPEFEYIAKNKDIKDKMDILKEKIDSLKSLQFAQENEFKLHRVNYIVHSYLMILKIFIGFIVIYSDSSIEIIWNFKDIM